MKKIITALSILMFSLVSATPVYAASSYEEILTALDTVANFETFIKATGQTPGALVEFSLINVDGDRMKFSAVANDEGVAQASVPRAETKKSGIYQVALVGSNVKTSFEVFPDEMSVKTSKVIVQKQYTHANGKDVSPVRVYLADAHGNPLSSHEVTLESSRASDVVSPQFKQTDANGTATFSVSSDVAGVSLVSVKDVSTDTSLPTQAKIYFLKGAGVYKEIGGDPETLLLAQVEQSISRFIIDSVPATVGIDETVSFRVRVIDSSGALVPSYRGTVTFSSTDSNAILPGNYTFKATDQGQKTFDLALRFKEEGQQTLIAEEANNPSIHGEKTIEVLRSASPTGSGNLRITKPATGTYSVNTLEIAGEAPSNKQVVIFDNNLQIGTVQSSSVGRFSYTASLLADGEHRFHVAIPGTISSTVTVTIDSTPANVENASLSQSVVAPGSNVQISIRTDPDASLVQATIGSLIVDLDQDPNNRGLYKGTLTAPSQEGEYTINVIVTDRLGNASEPYEVGRLRVDSELTHDGSFSFAVPSTVKNVRAEGRNAAVELSWDPAQAASGIAFYRIYYGTDPNRINIVLNTKDNEPFARMENLQNGTKYYFQVVAVDKNGREGDNRSDAISATPSSAASSNGPVLCDPAPCPRDVSYPPNTPQDGPGVVGLIVASLVGSTGIRYLQRRKK